VRNLPSPLLLILFGSEQARYEVMCCGERSSELNININDGACILRERGPKMMVDPTHSQRQQGKWADATKFKLRIMVAVYFACRKARG